MQSSHDAASGQLVGLLHLLKKADWRRTYDDDASLYVEEYAHHYRVHCDEVYPARNLVGQAVRDAPGLVFGGVLALIGLPSCWAR